MNIVHPTGLSHWESHTPNLILNLSRVVSQSWEEACFIEIDIPR
jgi:hypothetical protein